MRLDELVAGGDNVNRIDVMGGDKTVAQPMGGKVVDQNAVSMNRSKRKARGAIVKKKIKVSREEQMDMSPTTAEHDMGQTDRMVNDFYNNG
jgi:hypothetical protein